VLAVGSAAEMLGWTAQTTLESGLQKTWSWFQAQ
jgi:dTDP-D-glucose 4,6-dehydratase